MDSELTGQAYTRIYTPWVLATAAAVLATLYLICRSGQAGTRKKRRPPGPRELPLFGSIFTLLFSKLKQHELLFQWSGEFGGVFRFTLGGAQVVVLSDSRLIREALQDPYINDRIPFPACTTIHGRENTGIAFASGPVWRDQQRFFLTVFRKVNASVINFEEIIATEGRKLLAEFDRQEGRAFDPSDIVVVTISNVILRIVTGKTYEYGDDELLRMAGCSERLANIIGPAGLLGMIPGLASLPLPVKGQLTDLMREMLGFIQTHVEEHKLTFDPKKPPTDFISCYLKEIAETADDEDSTFDEVNILQTCWDAMFPGYETTISAARWALHLIAAHPDAQARLRREILDLIESFGDRDGDHHENCLPSYADRHRLPYAEATVVECLRLRPVIPYVAPHVVSRDRKIGGYDVDVGSRVTINLWYLARSPTLWDSPDEFRPERFLDESGAFDRSLEPMPFSHGRRTCPGEPLARMELFLFLTYIVRRFTLKLPEGAEMELAGSMGATFKPDRYQIHAIRTEASD